MTLLPLRAIGAQRHPVEAQPELVPVGPVRGKAALEVRFAPLAQLGGEALRVGRRGSAGGSAAPSGRAGRVAREPRERVRRPSTASRAILHQGDALARQLGVPRVERRRARRAGPDAASSALRWASARE